MSLLKEQLYTTEYIYNLPDGERAELIDGQIYNMTPPRTKYPYSSTMTSIPTSSRIFLLSVIRVR